MEPDHNRFPDCLRRQNARCTSWPIGLLRIGACSAWQLEEKPSLIVDEPKMNFEWRSEFAVISVDYCFTRERQTRKISLCWWSVAGREECYWHFQCQARAGLMRNIWLNKLSDTSADADSPHASEPSARLLLDIVAKARHTG